MIKLNGIQVLALERLYSAQYVRLSTLAVLYRLGLVHPNTRILTAQGDAIRNEAWYRRVLGGTLEYKRIYSF